MTDEALAIQWDPRSPITAWLGKTLSELEIVAFNVIPNSPNKQLVDLFSDAPRLFYCVEIVY